MKAYLMSILLVVSATLYPVVSMSAHVEGQEINVVMLVCLIHEDKPHRIHVRSLSVNVTHNPIPMVTTRDSCAQALHELLTSGFEITESNFENLFKFVLTRQDQSIHKH